VNASNTSASWSSVVLRTLSKNALIAVDCINVVIDCAEAGCSAIKAQSAKYYTVSAAFFAFAFMLQGAALSNDVWHNTHALPVPFQDVSS